MGIHESEVAHVDTRTLESALGLILIGVADDAIHMAVIRQLRDKTLRNAERITNHHALHGLKLRHKTWCTRWRVSLDEGSATGLVKHFFFGEIVPSHPVGFLLLGLYGSSHQKQ